jgi:hypothetical protein
VLGRRSGIRGASPCPCLAWHLNRKNRSSFIVFFIRM